MLLIEGVSRTCRTQYDDMNMALSTLPYYQNAVSAVSFFSPSELLSQGWARTDIVLDING